ncbi:MAG: lmo0937 family membrane protein [Caulobacteraceae bacterium]
MWIIIAIVLVLLWIFGFLVFHIAGFLIHILLLIALVALIVHFVRGRRGAP